MRGLFLYWYIVVTRPGYIFSSTGIATTKLGRIVGQYTPYITGDNGITKTRLPTNVNGFISTSIRPLTTKLDKKADKHALNLLFRYGGFIKTKFMALSSLL